MTNSFADNLDTIVALSTPTGSGAIGVIRVSGSNAIEVLNKLFNSKDLTSVPSHTLHVGLLKLDSEVLDEVVLAIYRNPSSYTGEDVIEISCHGSAFVQSRIINVLIELGCRLAKPGEFTQRAFLNGKLDLTQAEAVADLIASNTNASRNTAINSMRGGFKSVLSSLREKLLFFSSMIELELDFSTEDVEFVDRDSLENIISELIRNNSKLLNSFKLGNVIKNGVQTAIVGKPNTGKSTLLNALLNENRAIVSDIAGTTRDTIEEILNIDGILFRLIDTAGIRDNSGDLIENLGIEKSYEKMKSADIVLYLFDINQTSKEELKTVSDEFSQQGFNFILVGNKVDLTDNPTKLAYSDFNNILFISAKDDINLDELRDKLIELSVGGEINTESTVVTNIRHYEALKELDKSLNDVKTGLENNVPGDLLSLDIRQCLYYLGLITGEITSEEQLDMIFSKFCIGK